MSGPNGIQQGLSLNVEQVDPPPLTIDDLKREIDELKAQLNITVVQAEPEVVIVISDLRNESMPDVYKTLRGSKLNFFKFSNDYLFDKGKFNEYLSSEGVTISDRTKGNHVYNRSDLAALYLDLIKRTDKGDSMDDIHKDSGLPEKVLRDLRLRAQREAAQAYFNKFGIK